LLIIIFPLIQHGNCFWYPISDAQKKSFLVSYPSKNPIHIPIVAPFLLVKIHKSPPPKGGQSTALLNIVELLDGHRVPYLAMPCQDIRWLLLETAEKLLLDNLRISPYFSIH